jgi:hypothetical protein
MFEAILGKLDKGLFPLPSPQLLDSSETAPGGLLSPQIVSLPALAAFAMSNTIDVSEGSLLLAPPNELAFSTDLAQPQIIGKGLTEDLESLKVEKPGITFPLNERAKLQYPSSLKFFGEPDFLGSPALDSFLDELSPLQLLGRSYANRPTVPGGPRSYNGTSEPGNRDRSRCRHGLRFCSRCKRSSTPSPPPSRKGPGRIQDVLGRLRLILQPPLLERLNVSEIFPDGRRPYPFQVEGIRWLLDHREGLLADEMGLGKTMQAILALRVLFNRGELTRVLVVAPASVGATWERELMLWAPELSAVRVQRDPAQRDKQWRFGAEVHIVSYESLARDAQRTSPIAGIPFDLCIADEAQKIKNPATLNSRALRAISAKCSSRWALTGTPLENATSDAVSIFEFIAPSFRLDPRFQSPRQLRNAITPYLLRRTKRQVDVQFPELRHDMHWLDLSPGQRNAYWNAEYAGVEELRALGVNVTRLHIFSLITRLKLICNYDEVSGESCKLDFLLDSLDEISANGEKALVFSQYPHETLSKVADHLRRFNPLRFDASVNPRGRERVVEQFQEQDESDILLMGIRSGGMGITLTRANHVFHFDHWWNPAIVDQGSARVHRIGQQRPVFIHSLYTRGTIEERIDNILSRKRQLFQDVFGQLEDEKVTSRLSDEELFGLFGLEPPNVVQVAGSN